MLLPHESTVAHEDAAAFRREDSIHEKRKKVRYISGMTFIEVPRNINTNINNHATSGLISQDDRGISIAAKKVKKALFPTSFICHLHSNVLLHKLFKVVRYEAFLLFHIRHPALLSGLASCGS